MFTLPEHRGLGLGKQIIVATLVHSGDPGLSDEVSRDSTQWRWILFATQAKDMQVKTDTPSDAVWLTACVDIFALASKTQP